MQGRTLWNINSTASGGGVAEMLQVLVGYAAGEGVDTRWLVVEGDAEFFAITKRLHHHLHGMPGDGGPLGDQEQRHYTEVGRANGERLSGQVAAGDVVILHDPQTAALTAPLTDAGALVVWRSHIGADRQNDATRAAWSFLLPHLERVLAVVVTRAQYAPPGLDRDIPVIVIPPSIDPFSPKNQDLDDDTVAAVLSRTGLTTNPPPAGSRPRYTRRDGTEADVAGTADLVAGRPLRDGEHCVVQVSRWDPLKDMAGVMHAFVASTPRPDRHLLLVGPSVAGVADDPEGAVVLEQCRQAWRDLGPQDQDRVTLVSLPMDDVDENAAMVNAVQRRADVVVQKSLAEGFGLTVTEAMWKGRTVVASPVGGIPDQIAAGTGVLLHSADDLSELAAVIDGLLDDGDRRAALGAAARRHVRDNFVGDLHLIRYGDLLVALTSGG